jgi:mono/diheme cytochrome c family protein
MDKHIDECAKVFLRDQKQLFDEPVAYDLVLAVLKDGKKGLLGHMPSFNERLNETQEKALASYIRSLGDK